MNDGLLFKRIKDIGNRDASLIKNSKIKVIITDKAGMVPELSAAKDNFWINAHWLPHFRGNTGKRYQYPADSSFWPVELLYEIAGNFPCLPNFGPPCTTELGKMPAHGHTAHKIWKNISGGVLDNSAYSISELKGDLLCNLEYIKYDIVLSEEPVHYTVIDVKNNNSQDRKINAAWHNTVGSPFLESGCKIDMSSVRFAVPPNGSEFENTGCLEIGAEFENISKAPLRKGGTVDLRTVPCMTGYTDLVAGAVPKDAVLGWISVVNPRYKMIYMPFFKGPAAIRDNEIPLYFNILWMQYGGRKYVPWANTEGGTDLEYCLGVENATGAFANGLSYSIENKELMGNPTTIIIKAGDTQRLYYGTVYSRLEGDDFCEGIKEIRKDGQILLVESKYGDLIKKIPADPDFLKIKSIVSKISINTGKNKEGI